MNQNVRMFGVALLILTLITAAILMMVAVPTNPLSWLLVAAVAATPYIYKKLTPSQYCEWKDEYSVGIDSIDQQHRKLLNLINQLQTAVNYSTGESFEQEALDELVDYTKTHFSYEEGLLEKYEYPGYEPHKAQHIEMINKV
ncbi:MAG: bacteriohemerythrin, partial [Gammaproteobacteria bacterium]|nr:bacteriohemerythrin [Gammaproteobacteria bacterium]